MNEMNIQLKKHMSKKHIQIPDIPTYSCEICEFGSESLVDMWNHREANHSRTTPDFQPNSKQDMAHALMAEQN